MQYRQDNGIFWLVLAAPSTDRITEFSGQALLLLVQTGKRNFLARPCCSQYRQDNGILWLGLAAPSINRITEFSGKAMLLVQTG